MTTTPAAVTLATTGDAALVGRVLAAAFADDPVGHWIAPDARTRPRRLARLFEMWARDLTLPHEQTLRAGDLGAALWLPPGCWRTPPLVLLRQLPQLGRLFGTRTPLLLHGSARMERHHPRAPHWYLPLMGVLPGHQGQGIGSALLRAVLQRCDDEGLPAYLEATCERNRALYARHGFAVQEVLHLPAGPPLWAMWREPRQGRS